jgi:hypothetical protein
MPEKGWKSMSVRIETHKKIVSISKSLGKSVPETVEILASLKLSMIGLDEGENVKNEREEKRETS